MLLDALILIAGFVLLALSSDRFVLGASAIARNFGVAPMVIGLTVMALGTSSPEMLVSLMAALEGSPSIALGNVVGSNIANMTLVAGASAVAVPLVVASKSLRREFPMLLIATGVAWATLRDGTFSGFDAVILLALTAVVLAVIVRTARTAGGEDPLEYELGANEREKTGNAKAALWLLVGLVLMVLGSRMVVLGASDIARGLGMSELVIGLTIVAIGTSLPELAASVTSALRGQPDMAVGNVLGSNLFNLLPVLALAGVVSPFAVAPVALERDFPIMVALMLLLMAMCVGRGGVGRITRFNGVLLLACFVGYQGYLYVAQA